MTVSDLFSRSLALLNEDESRCRAFKRNCIPLVNQLLADCLTTENAIRESKGKALLKTAAEVGTFDDTVPYDVNFVNACLPYGLAALLCSDDDRSMSNAMGAQYEDFKKSYKPVNFEPINNYYK